jgi:hypothetical protein
MTSHNKRFPLHYLRDRIEGVYSSSNDQLVSIKEFNKVVEWYRSYRQGCTASSSPKLWSSRSWQLDCGKMSSLQHRAILATGMDQKRQLSLPSSKGIFLLAIIQSEILDTTMDQVCLVAVSNQLHRFWVPRYAYWTESRGPIPNLSLPNPRVAIPRHNKSLTPKRFLATKIAMYQRPIILCIQTMQMSSQRPYMVLPNVTFTNRSQLVLVSISLVFPYIIFLESSLARLARRLCLDLYTWRTKQPRMFKSCVSFQ